MTMTNRSAQDDLIHKLRNSDDLTDQQITFACVEAADEIERLRAALTEIKSLLGRQATPDERSVLRYAAFKTADVALGYEQSTREDK